MNPGDARRMLNDKDADGEYKIPFLVVCDAFESETTAFADLVLPDTTYLERHDVMSLLDRPISEFDGPIDSVRVPVVPPTGECRPFQDVLVELAGRLEFPAFVTPDKKPKFKNYADFVVNFETEPGSGQGFLIGWRGKDGDKALVGRIRVRGYEMGLEARPFLYPAAFRSLAGSTAERVNHLVETARQVAAAVRTVVGNRVHETPVIAELLAEDILEIAMERAGMTAPPIVPYEAASALAMLLLRDHGVITVQLVGVPPGTSAVMLKFIAPETLARFGGAGAYARAIDDCLTKLAGTLAEPEKIARLVLGD
jgi:hypothetical protein